MTDQPTTGRVTGRVRLGILGLGAVAQAVHLPLIERLRDAFSISAIADLSPTLTVSMGEQYRVPPGRRFGSLDELVVADDLDALLILSSGSHGRAILAGLDHGLAVFSEKPMAHTLAEADAIGSRLSDDSSLRLQVGYMKLYDPAVVRALADQRTGARGAPRAIEITVLHPTSESQLAFARLLPPAGDADPDTIAALRAEAAGLRVAALGPAADSLGELYEGLVLGSIVHELALIRAFAGNPTAIDAVDVWPDGRFPPSVSIVGRLPNEGRVSINWHFLPEYPAYREQVRVIYESASAELEFPAPYLLHRPTQLRLTERRDEGQHVLDWSSTDEAFEHELLAFHALVTVGTPPAAGLTEGRADIVTAQRVAACLAARRGLAIGGEAAG